MRKLLLEQEQVEIRCRPHARILIWPIFVGLCTIMAGSAALAKLQPGPFAEWAPGAGAWREPLLVVLVVSVVLLLLAYPARRVLRWAGTQYTLTNQRLLVRKGLFGKKLQKLVLAHAQEVRAVQNWRQRMVDSGDLQLLMHPDTVVTVAEIPHWSEFNKDTQYFWAMQVRASMQQTTHERDYAGEVGMNEKELRKLGRDH